MDGISVKMQKQSKIQCKARIIWRQLLGWGGDSNKLQLETFQSVRTVSDEQVAPRSHNERDENNSIDGPSTEYLSTRKGWPVYRWIVRFKLL